MPVILPEATPGEKRNLIREAYLNPNSDQVAQLASENLKRGQYLAVSRTPHDWSVQWENPQDKEDDFHIFDYVLVTLWESRDKPDDEFWRDHSSTLQELLGLSPLFQQLQRTVSGGSDNESVFAHIFHVLEQLRTDSVDGNSRFLSRVEVIFHDPGKIIALIKGQDSHVISGDYIQMHAAVSARIWREYSSRLVDTVDTETLGRVEQVIAQHHLVENLDSKYFTLDDFGQIASQEIRSALYRLTMADVLAAHPGEWSVFNMAQVAELLLLDYTVESLQDSKSFGILAQNYAVVIESTAMQIIEFMSTNKRRAENMFNRLQAFINILFKFSFAETVRSFILSLSEKLAMPLLTTLASGTREQFPQQKLLAATSV